MTKRGGSASRVVTLRHEIDGPDQRSLWAYLIKDGDLRIEGQDLGPKTALVSPDGEYEWFQTIKKDDIPRLLTLLGASRDADVLEVLEHNWTGEHSYELSSLLRASDIDVELFVWS